MVDGQVSCYFCTAKKIIASPFSRPVEALKPSNSAAYTNHGSTAVAGSPIIAVTAKNLSLLYSILDFKLGTPVLFPLRSP